MAKKKLSRKEKIEIMCQHGWSRANAEFLDCSAFGREVIRMAVDYFTPAVD